MTSPVDLVLARLQQVRRTRRGGVGLCPSHDDHHPSLAVSEGADGRALIVCRAGCATTDVVKALGLRWSDLFPPSAGHASPERRPRHLDEADAARRDVLAEARRLAERIDIELYADADSIRICDRAIRRARDVAMQLGPCDAVFDLLEKAAALDTMTRALEARLDAA